MKSLQTYIKAALVCAVVNAIYVYFTLSSSLLDKASVDELEMSRMEIILYYSEITDNFWPHLFVGWAHGFALSIVSCVILLLWLVLETHNQQRNSDSGADAPPPVR
jgi:hypothetical protein